jgi:hypothetical protein
LSARIQSSPDSNLVIFKLYSGNRYAVPVAGQQDADNMINYLDRIAVVRNSSSASLNRVIASQLQSSYIHLDGDRIALISRDDLSPLIQQEVQRQQGEAQQEIHE